MPLPGGASDKVGNRYERLWAVHLMLEMLAGRADSLEIEVPGDEGAGSEFRVGVRGASDWHQVKRQRTIAALRQERVLQHFLDKLKAGDQCVFVSTHGSPQLNELAERARDSAD